MKLLVFLLAMIVAGYFFWSSNLKSPETADENPVKTIGDAKITPVKLSEKTAEKTIQPATVEKTVNAKKPAELSEKTKQEIKALFAEGEENLAKGNMFNVTRSFEEILQKDPSNIEAMKILAITYQANREFDRSAAIAEKCLENDSLNSSCYISGARSYMFQNDFDTAKKKIADCEKNLPGNEVCKRADLEFNQRICETGDEDACSSYEELKKQIDKLDQARNQEK